MSIVRTDTCSLSETIESMEAVGAQIATVPAASALEVETELSEEEFVDTF